MRRPGSLAPLAIAAALLTGAVVGVVAWASDGHALMPGGLRVATDSGDHEVHGGVHSHAEIHDCGACHPGPLADVTASDKCLACHDDIATQLGKPRALHARLKARGRCLVCHTEHKGPDGDLTHIDRAHFNHKATGFSLRAHRKTKAGAPFRCADCHGSDIDHFDPDRCERCHRRDDAAFVTRHVTAWGNACRACHDGVDRFSRNVFNHAHTRFALTGKHVGVACARCHKGVRALAGYGNAKTACVACHRRDDVHKGRLGGDCAHCHTTGGWKKIIPGSFDHDKTRFPLTGAHVHVACARCHRNGQLAGTPRACARCHQRPRHHFAGACNRCHSTTRWRDARRPARTIPRRRGADATTNASRRRGR